MLGALGEPLRAPMAWPRDPEWPPDGTPRAEATPEAQASRWSSWANTIAATSKMITMGQAKPGRTRKPPSWRSFKEVSVSGIDATMDRRSPLLRRVLWACVLIVCTSLMFAQCLDRILRYSDEPVTVSVRVTHNTSLAFPALTLCNMNPFNRTAVLELSVKYNLLPADAKEDQVNVSLLVGQDGMSATDVWEKIAHKRELFIIECLVYRKMRCEEIGAWFQVHTVIGTCYTFKLHAGTIKTVGSFSSLFIRLHETTPIDVKGHGGVIILLHEPRISPELLIRTHSITAELGWSRDIKLELRKFQMLDTSSSPCVEDASYSRDSCTLQCFQYGLNEYSKCRMPFMIADAASANMSDCNSPAEYEDGMRAVNEMLLMGRWSASDCECEHECFVSEYHAYPNNLAYKPNQTRLRIFYSDLVYEQITEELAYSMISLLCDIGGTLGLLMGASVLTVCELLEVAWSKVLLRCCRLEERRPPSLKPEMRQALAKLRPPHKLADSHQRMDTPITVTSEFRRDIESGNNVTLGSSNPAFTKTRIFYAFE